LGYNESGLKANSLEKGGEKMYLPREEGQGLVEYALILVLVALVVIAILALMGPQIANAFSRVTGALPST
jgi:pilus assembly protein Flp/PilA